jgi:hypothetical protein
MGYLDFHKLSTEEKLSIFERIEYIEGLSSFAVEKDWWVVRTLDVLFKTEIGPHLVFKGGTSLSKSWKLIERFSEDIDLAIDRRFLGFEEEITKKKEVTKLRKASYAYISNQLYDDLKEGFKNAGLGEVSIKLEEVKSSDQDPLIIEIYYPSVTKSSNYVLPRVLVEIGSRSQQEPSTQKPIQSDVAQAYPNQKFADDPIHILSINPEKTFLEKLFLLHEEFQRPKEKIRVDRLSRHLYDIHQIAQSSFANKALSDAKLFRSIVEHRQIFTRVGGVDYESHYLPNLNPIPPDDLIEAWEQDYKIMDKQMIYGAPVAFSELIQSISEITIKINALKY